MFLSAVANSTNENINRKYNCCITHQMALQHIGIGQIGDGITLLDKYFWDKEKCNRIGYILSDGFIEVFVPDLAEKSITKKEFYKVQNLHWITEGLVDFQSSLSQWFIRPDGNFHKAALDVLCEQLEILINGRKYALSTLYHPSGYLHYGKWIDNCYYMFLKVQNRDSDICAMDKTLQKETVGKNSNKGAMVPPAILNQGTNGKYDIYFFKCVAWG